MSYSSATPAMDPALVLGADHVEPVEHREPLYVRIGGQAVVRDVVHRFYDRLLADPAVNHHFAGLDIARLARHQTDFIMSVLGGPAVRSNVDLAAVHRRLGITDDEFDRVGAHLGAALREFGLPEPEVDEVLGIIETARAAIVTGPAADPLPELAPAEPLPGTRHWASVPGALEVFAGEAAAVFDAEGQLLAANRRFTRWFGSTRSIGSLLPTAPLERALTRTGRHFAEVVGGDPVLGDVPVGVCVRQLPDGALFVGRSLTRRREYEAVAQRTMVLLEQRTRALEKANAGLRAAEQTLMLQGRLTALGEVAARTLGALSIPMQFISTTAALIADELEDEELVALADTLVINSQKVGRALGAMTALTDRSDDGPAEHGLAAVVGQVVSLCRDDAERIDARLTVGPIAADLAVHCRRVPVCHALLAVLDNALQAVEGEPERTVRVDVTAVDGAVELAVIDSGPGVPASLAERIFEAFFASQDGAGMGLTNARRIARAHGGDLWLDVDAPQTRFVLRLPR